MTVNPFCNDLVNVESCELIVKFFDIILLTKMEKI